MTGIRNGFREWVEEDPFTAGLIAGVFLGGGAATALYATPLQTTVFLAVVAAVVLGATAVVAARDYSWEVIE